MKWIVRGLGALVVLVLLVVGIGMLIPESHTATASLEVDGAPAQVWHAITDVEGYAAWRSDVDEVEVLNRSPDGLAWRETGSTGSITFRVVEAEPLRRWRPVIADEELPFGGSWTYELEAVGDGRTRLTVTENGEIYNPFFRFVARFVLGYSATMERYLADLEAHLAGAGGVGSSGALQGDEGLWPLNGTELYVQRLGAGGPGAEPVIVVHGGPLLDHGYLEPYLAPLGASRELIFYDQRLNGRSAADVDSASVRVATFVEDIEALRDRMGAPRLHLLAHSWGGHMALRYALQHGDRLASLVLVSPMPPSTELRNEEQERLAAMVSPEDAEAMAELRSSFQADGIEPDAIARFLRLSYRSQLHDPARAAELEIDVPDDYVDRSRQLSFMTQDLADFDLSPRLGEIQVPTLVIFGRDEPGAELTGPILRERIPGARLVVIPDAGHFSFLERPEVFLSAVRGFLDEVGSGLQEG